MLFEALVTRNRGKTPSGINSGPSATRRGALGGAVLVASKVLRSLALLAAYHALHSGLSSTFFASCTLGIASVALLALQRPWNGPLNGSAVLKLLVQSFLLGFAFVCWATGLHLCGPAVTVMLEYIEVILLRFWAMIAAQKGDTALRKGKLGHIVRSLALFAAACIIIVWERGFPVSIPTPSVVSLASAPGALLGEAPHGATIRAATLSGEEPESGEVILQESGVWGEDGWAGGVGAAAAQAASEDAINDAPLPFDFAARSAGEFLKGMGMLLIASAVSAVRKMQAVGASKCLGGPKRLFALSAPIAAIGLLPFVFFSSVIPTRIVLPKLSWLNESQQLPLFAVMGLLVPFYAGNFADKNLPGGESARVGLLASVMSFVITWAVRMSPVELSSRVVAITVAFVVMALGDDARDDSVPLGVYSVPGIRGDTGWGWTSAIMSARTFLRQTLANRQSRRIAAFLLLNFAFMLVEFVYGLWTNSLGLISDAVHMFFDCGALVVGLYGSLMSTWRPNTTYTYGYGRFEVLCGFVNAIFLMVVASFIFIEALGRLFDPPPISTDRLLVVSVSGFLVNLVGLFVFSDVGHGHSHGLGISCTVAHGNNSGCYTGSDAKRSPHASRALRSKRLLDDSGDAKALPNRTAAALISSYFTSARNAVGMSVKRFMSVDGLDANMMAVYLHVLADTLGSAGVIVSSILVEYKGWIIADPVCSVCIGSFIFLSVLPLLFEAGGTLLQRTPPEFQESIIEIRNKIMGIEGVLLIDKLHIWRQSSKMIVGTLNVQARAGAVTEDQVLAAARSILKEAGITDLCVQIDLVQRGGAGDAK